MLPDGTIWRVGDPHPPEPVPFERWELIDPRVVKAIRAEHRAVPRHGPVGIVYDGRTGRGVGTVLDLEIRVDGTATGVDVDHYIVIPANADANDIDWKSVRRDPQSGRISRPVLKPAVVEASPYDWPPGKGQGRR